MKHLIRNRWTKRYFAYGKWTDKVAQAQNFTNALSAITCCIQNNLKNVEMVLMLGSEPSPQDDILVPLSVS